jgi:predicted anti-sigma-YlaC factor YlaD
MAGNENRTCEKMEEDLVLYYYKELSGGQQTQVETHIKDCAPCRLYLQEMASILPSTVMNDDPPATFWTDYNREMRLKLSEVREKKAWWQSLLGLLQPWPRPAFAMAAVVVLALTITLGKTFWRSQESPPDDQALIEVLPVAENLEFFKDMDVLDAMDFLENSDTPTTKGTT